MSVYRLEIITPIGVFFDEEVESLVVESQGGQLCILKDHAPMVASIGVGEIKIKTDEGWKSAFTTEGFLEVRKNETVLFAQKCEWPEDIDRNRAIEDKERAEEAMRQKLSLREYKQSRVTLTRALVRLRITSRHNKID